MESNFFILMYKARMTTGGDNSHPGKVGQNIIKNLTFYRDHSNQKRKKKNT
jgi:hypothetical protein